MLLLAGVYLSILRLPQLSDLWTTGYGQVLLVKIGLVSLALAWGGVAQARRRAGGCARRRACCTASARRALLGESMVGMAVLLAAAVLVDAKPPRSAGAHAACGE